jgi:hypothetical protein
MTVNRTRKVIGTTAAVLLLSCNSPIDMAGIQGSGGPMMAFARGPITGFGSIFVNGVEYSTAGATVMIDDQPGAEVQLRTGQIVAVNGTVNADGTTGTATEVTFSGNVQGPATKVDPTGNTFVVLGQTVRVTDSTLYDDGIQPADLTGLKAGAGVEVSGFTDTDGDIVATRVDLSPVAGNLRVTGAVEALDTAAHTFRINGLTVDYGSSAVPDTLANGTNVVVRGVGLAATGELVASHVQLAPGLGAVVDQHVDLTGIITGITSLQQFSLQGQPVIIDLNTQLVLHGVPLGLNVEVDVKGTLLASGAVLAKKVEVRPQGQGLLGGLVDSVTSAGKTLRVLGVNVTTSADTRLADKSSQHLRAFGLSDVRVGDYVQIHGTQLPDGTFGATTLERFNPRSRHHRLPSN